ncbi:hypothetical protein FKW77_003266 [Venturia effusa]|uniref:GH16 domain-containing protein n=1 Tax=Venturia effusa TaxID=50376 RepID=A0A517LNM9_9PEZI|nr:hypothetical protein FKW77_003266 [Venturia effusa]
MISFSPIVTCFAFFASLTAATCECGFSINSTDSPLHQIFTEFIETDFTDGTLGGWVPQTYSVSKDVSRGPYGKIASVKMAIPTKEGLELWVEGLSKDSGGSILMAEISTHRSDMIYGSFRVKAKMTDVPGTCAGFFWYSNDTQEIDMEFLSKQYANFGIVNLVNQSPKSQAAGFNAASTPGFKVQHLPFRPDSDFHEYRFDWMPGSITYYADGIPLQVFTQDLPGSPGHVILNHWSNGDPGWSGGPPTQDTAVTIEYARLYFNSSDAREKERFIRACPFGDSGKVCDIGGHVALMPPVSTTANSWEVPGKVGPPAEKRRNEVIGAIVAVLTY